MVAKLNYGLFLSTDLCNLMWRKLSSVNRGFCDLFLILMQRFVGIDLNCFK